MKDNPIVKIAVLPFICFLNLGLYIILHELIVSPNHGKPYEKWEFDDYGIFVDLETAVIGTILLFLFKILLYFSSNHFRVIWVEFIPNLVLIGISVIMYIEFSEDYLRENTSSSFLGYSHDYSINRYYYLFILFLIIIETIFLYLKFRREKQEEKV